MEKIYRYFFEGDSVGGIVIADTEDEAKEKVIQAYKKHSTEGEFNYNRITVWRAYKDDDWFEDSPDVLEVYC